MKIYNNQTEIGLRILILLNELQDKACDIDTLVYYDHLLLHSGDAKNGPSSILPKSPFRYLEVLSKRESIGDAITFLWTKDLISVDYKENGIYYKANRLTSLLLEQLESELSSELKDTAVWVVKTFSNYSIDDLKDYFQSELKDKSRDFSSIGFNGKENE